MTFIVQIAIVLAYFNCFSLRELCRFASNSINATPVKDVLKFEITLID